MTVTQWSAFTLRRSTGVCCHRLVLQMSGPRHTVAGDTPSSVSGQGRWANQPRSLHSGRALRRQRMWGEGCTCGTVKSGPGQCVSWDLDLPSVPLKTVWSCCLIDGELVVGALVCCLRSPVNRRLRIHSVTQSSSLTPGWSHLMALPTQQKYTRCTASISCKPPSLLGRDDGVTKTGHDTFLPAARTRSPKPENFFLCQQLLLLSSESEIQLSLPTVLASFAALLMPPMG